MGDKIGKRTDDALLVEAIYKDVTFTGMHIIINIKHTYLPLPNEISLTTTAALANCLHTEQTSKRNKLYANSRFYETRKMWREKL